MPTSSSTAGARPDWSLTVAPPLVSIAGGTLHFERSLRVQEALAPGLKLVLVLDGDLRYSAAGESVATDISGPSLHLSLCRDASLLDHEFGYSQLAASPQTNH